MDSDLVFLTGINGQGKTSLLEAVAVAARLSSPRASKQSQIIRDGALGCGVAIEMRGVLNKAIYQDRKFKLSLNGNSVMKKQYLSESPKVVWMENRDLDLIRGSGEKRRRFLDVIGGQLSHEYATSLRAYTKALRSRNVLLKEGRSGAGSFQAFTELLVKHGIILIKMRETILKDLLPHALQAQGKISDQREDFLMKFEPSCVDLESGLAEGLGRDVIMKQTLIGPHRDDFTLLVDGRPASDFASEGQQRTLAIALKLAQGELLLRVTNAENVIYLVDDVFGELDTMRRQAFLKALPHKSSKLLTTTSLNWGEVNGQVFQVKNGQVTSEKN